MARRWDGRWTREVLEWTPVGGFRNRGHPKRRWLDSLIGYFRTRLDETSVHWTVCAADREAWTELEDDFVLREWIL